MLSIIICLLLMLLAVALDQLSKYIIVTNMTVGQSIDVIPGVFRFTYVQNTGAAFGSLSEARWVFMILSTVAIIAIVAYLFWKKPQNKLLLSALILITGGGIGNMIDRVFRVGFIRGKETTFVVDFLDFCAFPNIWKWVFNIADSFVCIGAGLLALWMILDTVKEYKLEKASRIAESAAEKGNSKQNGDENE